MYTFAILSVLIKRVGGLGFYNNERLGLAWFVHIHRPTGMKWYNTCAVLFLQNSCKSFIPTEAARRDEILWSNTWYWSGNETADFRPRQGTRGLVGAVGWNTLEYHSSVVTPTQNNIDLKIYNETETITNKDKETGNNTNTNKTILHRTEYINNKSRKKFKTLYGIVTSKFSSQTI